MVALDDGTTVYTKVVTTIQEIDASINMLLESMTQRRKMLVGFALEWGVSCTSSSQMCLLKLCADCDCVFVRIYKKSTVTPSLVKFLASKDHIFAGVHIKEDMEKLRRHYGLVVDNAVELSELTSGWMGKPALAAFGARDLAFHVLRRYFDPKPVDVFWSNILDDPLSIGQIRSAATDVYAAYIVGERVLATPFSS